MSLVTILKLDNLKGLIIFRNPGELIIIYVTGLYYQGSYTFIVSFTEAINLKRDRGRDQTGVLSAGEGRGRRTVKKLMKSKLYGCHFTWAVLC